MPAAYYFGDVSVTQAMATLNRYGQDKIMLADQMPPFLGSAFNDNFDVPTHDSTGRFVYARLSHSF